jgi:hypothetical protein
MLPLEAFEENKYINEKLEKINRMIEQAMKSTDKDELTISFYQDIINKAISRINWKIQSMNEDVQHELINIIYDLDADKYYRLREFIRDFWNNNPPDND